MVETTEKQPQEKHAELQDTGRNTEAVEEIEVTQNCIIKQRLNSAFINHQKSWDDEAISIPEEIQKGITDCLGFSKPSKIQGVAIPYIAKKSQADMFEHLKAQGKNGSGKTGAFAIGTTLRVDPSIPKTQVLVLCHIRELANQIADVYEKVNKFSKVSVNNFQQTQKVNDEHVVTSCMGSLEKNLKSKRPMDLSHIRCVVIDEADFFFGDDNNLKALQGIHKRYLSQHKDLQYILFSATFDQTIDTRIMTLIGEAQQINLKTENLQLGHVQQFQYRCEPKGKIDFVQKVFQTCALTQTIIFVNTKKFASTVAHILNKKDCHADLIDGSTELDKRDSIIEKFRSGEIRVLVTTSMLARGLDIPDVQIVINFDVPQDFNSKRGDPPTYLHRIGRTGRFGTKGVALTLYDRDLDKEFLDEILDYYHMNDKCPLLDNAEHLSSLLEEISKVDDL